MSATPHPPVDLEVRARFPGGFPPGPQGGRAGEPGLRAGEPGLRAGEPVLPVLSAFASVLPGLPRGQVVSVPGGLGAGGSRSGVLPWALVAQAVADGAWCAVVGLPEAGVLAAVDLGVDVDRLLLVDDPGSRWPDVTATLLAAVDLVVVQTGRRPASALVRRLSGLARRHRCVLVAVGEWEGAAIRVQVAQSAWAGIGVGHGRLTGRRALVDVSGRGAGTRTGSIWLWLPGPDGSVAVMTPDQVADRSPADVPGRLAAVG